MIKLTEYKLSDLYKMDSGIGTTKEQAGHGAPFISFSDIFNNPILPDGLTQRMDTTIDEQHKYSVKKGDILLTRTSETVDELAMTSVAIKDYPTATFSGFAKRLRPTQNNITYDKYMAFLLRSEYFRKIINAKTIMTLRASFNEDIFKDIKILLPDYDIQVKIGDFLYNIERQIQNNNKINIELEQLATNIYNYWFLQFDFPNECGKPYKSSGGKMICNDILKREIPENWEVKTLDYIAEQINGFAFSSNDYVSKGKYKLYTIKNVQDGEIISKVDNYIDQLPSKMNSECLLSTSDIIMSLTGNVGRIGLVYEKNALLNQRVLKLKEKKVSKEFLYLLLRNDFMKQQIEKIASGTSQKNLSPIELGKIKILIPPTKILEKFNNLTNNFINTIVLNYQENEELKSLRDFLLPLLMNGQVSFTDK